VEPSVQLDDEVIIKVSLDVSNLIRTVNGPAGSIAYQVGTRNTNTSLRLRDGETQILAGLINDEDRRSNSGLPGLSELPFFGRLFGVRSDSRNKTEVVLLITPRIIRNLALPASQLMWLEAGTDAQPGLPVLRLADQGSAAVAAGTGGGTGGSASPQAQARAANSGVVMLAGSSTASVGETVSVTLSNPSAAEVSGDIFFDGSRFVSAVVAGEVGTELNSTASDGRVPFRLNAGGSFVVVLRVLPAAAGTRTALNAQVNTARSPSGALVDVRIEGEVEINVPVAAATAAPAAAGGAPKP
jgi:general secretion pathway protein D